MNEDPLAQLRDIHVPDSISWWPPAPGWWLLGVLLIAAVVAIAVWRYRVAIQNRYRGEAVEALEMAWQRFKQDNNTDAYVLQLTQILKRTALTAYPKFKVNALHGREWLYFLNATSADKSAQFSQGVGRQLLDLPYRKINKNLDLALLHELVLSWLANHRPQKAVPQPERRIHAPAREGASNAAA